MVRGARGGRAQSSLNKKYIYCYKLHNRPSKRDGPEQLVNTAVADHKPEAHRERVELCTRVKLYAVEGYPHLGSVEGSCFKPAFPAPSPIWLHAPAHLLLMPNAVVIGFLQW